MIKQIRSAYDWKRNWIDQNNVVFGYSDSHQCCESFDWGVWYPVTRQKVAIDPDGMPYHFVFNEGARTDEPYFEEIEFPEVLDVVHVTMEHDDDKKKRLVFECWCNHNGYYYHDFDFENKDEKPKQ